MTRGEAVEQVRREFEQLRGQNQREQEARVEDAKARDPYIAVLLDGMARRYRESTRNMLMNRAQTEKIVDRLRADTLKDRAEIKARLAGLGLAGDYLDVRPRCADCADSGYADEQHARYCACFEKRVNQLRYPGVGNEAHQFSAFDSTIYPGEEQRLEAERARDVCAAYAESYPLTPKPNLTLMGKSGLGKTFLLDAIADRVAQRGYVPMRMTAFQMLTGMRAYHFGDNQPGSALDQMMSCPLLLIDDLGTEPLLKNITVEYLFLLLNERLAAGRHTVIATNLNGPELAQQYGERVLSRLMDRTKGDFLRLTGADLRYRRTT